MKRFEALRIILDSLSENDLALFTTGRISREAFFIRDRIQNFYMLGSMGLLSSFSLGIAYMCREKKVIVCDGDGSLLMGLGGMAMIGVSEIENIVHIVLDNGVYASTGNQDCISLKINLLNVAKGFGYRCLSCVSQARELQRKVDSLRKTKGPIFLLIKIALGDLERIPRVYLDPNQMKIRFMNSVAN